MGNATRRSSRVAFLYWGRQGALSKWTLEIARTMRCAADLEPLLCVSTSNALYSDVAKADPGLFAQAIFPTASGALTGLYRLPGIVQQLVARLAAHGTEDLVVLMPHVWTPLIAPFIVRAGIRYNVIVHDADPHPGDPTALVQRWLLRDAQHAKTIVTLSQSVARRLVARGVTDPDRLAVIPHPDLKFDVTRKAKRPQQKPLRLLFFGRVLPYKGLSLLVEAAEMLTREGVPISLGVFGEGNISPLRARLAALDAEVVNRWIDESEIPGTLSRHDVMVLPYLEASQSGVASVAYGAGMPVIATPVGGLVEQVEHGRSGLIARSVEAAALAECIRVLADDQDLYRNMTQHIEAGRQQRTMAQFLSSLVGVLDERRSVPRLAAPLEAPRPVTQGSTSGVWVGRGKLLFPAQG
jgi:glycosyltransferase involved in cell wall biosynthesis